MIDANERSEHDREEPEMNATLDVPSAATEPRTSPAWIAARMNRLPATKAIWKLVVLL